MKKMPEYQEAARRLFEVGASLVLLVVVSPLLAVTALAVWLTDFGPFFFMQVRAGLGGKPFQLVKFRSMTVNDRPISLPDGTCEDDARVTTIGRVIRRLKIDELPQLINVIRGEMSWVGPRPTIIEQVENYTPFQRRRLEVLPGLTGWAQVNGGAEISWDDRIMLEVWYVENRSLWLDAKILLKTITVIVFGHKANPPAVADALRFVEQQGLSLNDGLRIKKPEISKVIHTT